MTGEQLEQLRRLLADHRQILGPFSWDRAALGSLLRFGRKHDGPWDEDSGPIPDETDVDLICSAVEILPALLDEVNRLRQIERASRAYLAAEQADVPEDASTDQINKHCDYVEQCASNLKVALEQK